MQLKISLQLVCGSCGACLKCMFPGVQATTGLGFFLCVSHLCYSEDCEYFNKLDIPCRSLVG